MSMAFDLSAGFADKVTSAQSTFRAVMQAMARPGTVQRVEGGLRQVPAPLTPATAAIALTLFDHDTPLWLDEATRALAVTQWLRFHTSAPLVDEGDMAAFGLIADPLSMPALERFALGSNDYPDRSTTLILQLGSLADGSEFELCGPGIRGTATLRAPLPASLLAQRDALTPLFPRGLDLILAADDAIVALPRTTRLVAKGGN
ncbi:phosphonate C-P lyase system protein PhnH [Rhodopseudomonas sp. HC1]|uniref:phosphonate C-P lyase system protein PhnH n=1 Tax=Rhodopseudomonas infernalis TaxID=2897386 RepID=UPI001EE79B8E|nr:phosphonate C-P lyase system protein PhnH [Rhodopseudomonas infernalis]MCG6205560.1 phosphonate C-P lyase system protein PhnH [Rhodopseudomonas infernalis]